MSWPEYIVQIEPHEEGDLYHMRGEPEPIVRCRDCKHMCDDIDGYTCQRSSGEYHWCELDGFCAWGERKND